MRKKNYTRTLLFEYYVRSQLVQDIDRKSFFLLMLLSFIVRVFCPQKFNIQPKLQGPKTVTSVTSVQKVIPLDRFLIGCSEQEM